MEELKIKAYKNSCFLIIESSELGIKSIIEIVSITPLANPRALLITPTLSFLINTNKKPTRVDNPAILVSKKAYILFDIISPINFMLLL
jgi:hypothetical protein